MTSFFLSVVMHVQVLIRDTPFVYLNKVTPAPASRTGDLAAPFFLEVAMLISGGSNLSLSASRKACLSWSPIGGCYVNFLPQI